MKLSEILSPDCLWLAYGYPANMTIDLLDFCLESAAPST